MKLSYKHLLRYIKSNPSIDELSGKLFQLGHEHEVFNEIFDMEFTPNRGDCLSIRGLLRDLKLFYDIHETDDIYDKEISPFKFQFINNAEEFCSKISFLKIEIDKIPSNYVGSLNDYINDLNIKKNNFFTDVSNFISYDTGQPTHCYDSSKIQDPIKLDFNKRDINFDTLLKKTIELKDANLVFFDKNDEIINLAGVMGGDKTACNEKTKSVIVECAHFDPEIILGQTLKYGINSEAAHKFERNTDPNCHEYALRRFIHIVENHADISKVELFSYNTDNLLQNQILFDVSKINKILGTNFEKSICKEYLTKLGFTFKKDLLQIPTYRSDIRTMNDISEEVARAFGYDNIKTQTFNITNANQKEIISEESKLKNLLVDSGFYEIISNPFSSDKIKSSIAVDNPLDSNKSFLRTDLKNSLINKLSYNERRQKDSIKLFEVSDIYTADPISIKRVCGIIATGRISNNYRDFHQKIDINYLENLLGSYLENAELNFTNISRELIDSKIKDPISYIEIEINDSISINYQTDNNTKFNISNKQYIPTSDFPSSSRDLSFSITNFTNCKNLENFILTFNHDLLKEVFVFDYFKNEKIKEIKIGFRFIFQSRDKTITDEEVNRVMDIVIENALQIETVKIPGLL